MPLHLTFELNLTLTIYLGKVTCIYFIGYQPVIHSLLFRLIVTELDTLAQEKDMAYLPYPNVYHNWCTIPQGRMLELSLFLKHLCIWNDKWGITKHHTFTRINFTFCTLIKCSRYLHSNDVSSDLNLISVKI